MIIRMHTWLIFEKFTILTRTHNALQSKIRLDCLRIYRCSGVGGGSVGVSGGDGGQFLQQWNIQILKIISDWGEDEK